MVKFRRSMKGDKENKPLHISIQPKDAIAIVPPKKVIKALYDYEAQDQNGYLSFSQGDFLHVVARENDTDWYEACNPLIGTRGLVPVSYFETVGKTVRDSGSSARSVPLQSAGHDSGYGEKTPNTAASINTPGIDSEPPRSARFSKPGFPAGPPGMAAARGVGAMVYGMVMYDFKAERPDELEAKEGEAIIIIAQSNPEWFVAKPITRLGGPGLIPVSFIEIRDMTTGTAVPDALDAVRRAGVPKVEEWKKMAADYKNGSIPLGKLEANAAQSLEQGMQRMSINNKGQANNSRMSATTMTGQPRAPSSYGQKQQQQQQQYRQSTEQLLAPISAHVPRYCFADEIFWFVIECQMEDGRHWELSRLYQDFYDLQINLIQEFPYEAGNVAGVERSLPYMPGPVTYVTDNISNGRRANLDEYIQQLLKLDAHVSRGRLVCEFFKPRAGDYEIDPNVAQDQYRLSSTSQQSASNASQGASRQSSAGNLAPGNNLMSPSYNGNPYGQLNPHRGHNSISSQQTQHYRQQSDLQAPPPMLRANSALTQASASSASSAAAIKLKVWFDDDCIVIRLQPGFRYVDLYKKLKERHMMERPSEPADEALIVEYRDEVEGAFYRIENDEDLSVALDRNPKLTLSVTTARKLYSWMQKALLRSMSQSTITGYG